MIPKIPFNGWSRVQLRKGTKCCTSRTKRYDVEGVIRIELQPLRYVRDVLWEQEGASSPEEFERVWKGIHPIKGFVPTQLVYVHFFINPYEVKDDKTKIR